MNTYDKFARHRWTPSKRLSLGRTQQAKVPFSSCIRFLAKIPAVQDPREDVRDPDEGNLLGHV